MDEAVERLYRRTALYRRKPRPGTDAVETTQYLRMLQYEMASTVLPDGPQSMENVGPAYLRARARHFRELAQHQSDRERQRVYQELAASFEESAAKREKLT
jgi:hypothetical protein